MANAPAKPQTVDPDNVPETFCNGGFYLTWSGSFGTLTFTHTRPKVGPLFGGGQVEDEQVVRARIILTAENMAALRDLLADKIKGGGDAPTAGAAGESTKH